MKRRDFLELVAIDLAALGMGTAFAQTPANPPATLPLTLERLQAAPGRVLDTSGKEAPAVKLTRTWEGNLCKASITNTGKRPVRVREIIVVVADPRPAREDPALRRELPDAVADRGLPRCAREPRVTTRSKHYKMPQPEGVAHAVTGLVLLRPPGQATTMLAFSSCRRFAARFLLRKGDAQASPASIEVWQDGEGLALAPGETWQLEEVMFAGRPRAQRAAGDARRAHQRATTRRCASTSRPPAGAPGTASGPKVTAEDVATTST